MPFCRCHSKNVRHLNATSLWRQEARIALTSTPYNKSGNKGLTLQLTAVQVISLAERQGGSGFVQSRTAVSQHRTTMNHRLRTVLATISDVITRRFRSGLEEAVAHRKRPATFPSYMKRQQSTMYGQRVRLNTRPISKSVQFLSRPRSV